MFIRYTLSWTPKFYIVVNMATIKAKTCLRIRKNPISKLGYKCFTNIKEKIK